MNDAVKMALEALADIRTSIECAAGCDEGIDPMAAVSEIMSAYGTAMASAYSRAADMVNILTTLEQAGEPGADDARDKLAGEHGEQCERCQGNGEIVTDWDRYMHVHDGDVGDEAVADCPDCSGTGRIEGEAPLPTLQRIGQEFDAGEDELERIAAAIHESDPDVGCSWAEWVAYAEAHPDHLQSVDYTRRQARAVADIKRPEPPTAFTLLRHYHDAINARNDCAECENEGPWEHCGPCSERIGPVIAAQINFLAHPPQSRGQAFDGEGEACKPDRIKARADAIAHLTVPEDGNYKDNREYRRHFRIARDAALAAFEEVAALSSAKRGEEG